MAPNTSTTTEFPLASLLILYSRSSKLDTYINSFEGFKLLVQWLAPIAVPSLPYGIKKAPWCFYTYELQEMSKILGVSPDILYTVCLDLYEGAAL